MSVELKPCPFCGQKKTVVLNQEEDGVQKGMYQVICNCLKGGCGSSSGYWYFDEEAIEAWNRGSETGAN